MKRCSFGVFFLLPLLAACGGGSSGVRLPAVAAPLSTAVDPQAAEVQADALQAAQPQYVSSPSDLLYVANAGNNSITVYHYNAAGDTAPIRVIAGSKTGIKTPGQLSEDAKGNLYVANSAYFDGKNFAPDPSAGILVFAHGANGNVAPIRRLAGKHTQIHAVEAMTVDQTTGKIFVFDEPNIDYRGESAYLRFPPNATGDEAPYAVSQADNNPAVELASDSTGKNIIEAGSAPCCTAANAGMTTLPKQFANGALPYGLYGWSGAAPSGVADDPTTHTYLAMVNKYQEVDPPGIYRFAEDTDGYFPVDGFPEKFKPAIVSIVKSDSCGGQLALGYLRDIYVAHTKGLCSKDAVYVYAHDASGDATPLRILEGSATRLDQPTGIYEGQ